MERIIFNDDDLTTKEINDRVMKSRAIIVNSNGELLLCKYADMYFLPGGKIDDERYMCSGLEVEIKEETGINLDLYSEKPFLLVQQCIKNYPKRDNQGITNRLSETYYFIIETDEEIKPEEMALTEKEKEGGFSILRVHPSNIKELLLHHITDNPRNEFFTRELLTVIDKYLVKCLSSETEKHLDRFYHPEFTAFNFVCLLAGTLKLNDVNSFMSDDIEQFVIRCKEYGLYEELLKEIKVKSNGVYKYSNEFQEAITRAKHCGILYSVSPERDSKVYIEKNFDITQLSDYEKYFNKMFGFVSGIIGNNESFYGNSVANSIHELYMKYFDTQKGIQELGFQIENFKFEYSAEEQEYLNNLGGIVDSRPSFKSKMEYRGLQKNLMEEKDHLNRMLAKSIDFEHQCDHTFIRSGNDLTCVSCNHSISEYDEKIKALICLCAEKSGHLVDGATIDDYDFIKSLVEQCHGKVGYEVECDMFHYETTKELMPYYNQELRNKKGQDVAKVLKKVLEKKTTSEL